MIVCRRRCLDSRESPAKDVCACQRRAAARYSFSKRTRISRGASTLGGSGRSASGSSCARSTRRAGHGRPGRALNHGSQPIGLLVLDGLLVREATVGDHPCAELLGPGDLLRAWDDRDAEILLPRTVEWTALTHSRLAIIDQALAVRAAQWPEIFAALVERAARRAERLVVMQAIAHLTRVDDRLLALLWCLAERWGRVVPGGVLVSLRLPHRTLAGMVGARRPSVTTALGPADRPRGDRAPARRRLAAPRRPAGAALGEPPSAGRGRRARCASPRGSDRRARRSAASAAGSDVLGAQPASRLMARRRPAGRSAAESVASQASARRRGPAEAGESAARPQSGELGLVGERVAARGRRPREQRRACTRSSGRPTVSAAASRSPAR